MTLAELRTKFRDFSGRLDLDDPGVDFFINSGVRFLHSRATSTFSTLRYQKDLNANEFYVDVPGLAKATSVWIADDEGRTELEELSLVEAREKFPDGFDQATPSKPSYFAITVKDRAADQWLSTSTTTYDAEDVFTGTAFSRAQRLLILPPTDKLRTVTVFGHFVAAALKNDSDTNYWSEEYPDLVLFAALYKLETTYRNREGAQDWLTALDEGLITLEKDAVELEYGDKNVMEG